MLKILQAKLQQYVNFQMFKLDLEKTDKPEIKQPTSTGLQKKLENSREKKKTNIRFADYTKPCVVDHNKLWKILQEWSSLVDQLVKNSPAMWETWD